MPIFQIIILAIIQGLAELLPVSSSAHVIVAGKFFKLDASSPEMTFLLVMLHTGTMFAVMIYFWKRWYKILSVSSQERNNFFKNIILATGTTAVVGFPLIKIIEKVFLSTHTTGEIEHLFKVLPLISFSLLSVGILIWYAGGKPEKNNPICSKRAMIIGAIQGLCLPFRGFSRSGATISGALILGVPRALAEDFSFALAVVITPPVVVRQLLRLLKAHAFADTPISTLLMPGVLGMFFSFIAGSVALRWLSNWMEKGRWRWFGYYCGCAAVIVMLVHVFLG